MSESMQSRQFHLLAPPPAGLGYVAATSTTQGSIDLSTVGQITQREDSSLNPTASPAGLVGKMVEVFADTADVGIIFGPTSASVTGSNKPVLATNGTNEAGICYRIPAGAVRKWLITKQTQFCGYVATGAGQIRIFEASQYGG